MSFLGGILVSKVCGTKCHTEQSVTLHDDIVEANSRISHILVVNDYTFWGELGVGVRQ